MKKFYISVLLLVAVFHAQAQQTPLFEGMYIQWGYNLDAYTKSNIHFKLANGDDFRLHKARAHHKPGFDDIYTAPLEISLPQYNYRIGFYLNAKHTRSIELNFDHIKYVVKDGQTVRVTGTIGGKPVNGDSVLNSETFLHLEHTDGGNLLHVNYVQQHTVLMNKKKTRPLLNIIWKGGAGINIPRTDFTYRGDRFNNKFHVAGYNISAEAGARYYISKRFFFEGTAKTGFVRYVNALADTNALKGSRVSHGFGYGELILLAGYDFSF